MRNDQDWEIAPDLKTEDMKIANQRVKASPCELMGSGIPRGKQNRPNTSRDCQVRQGCKEIGCHASRTMAVDDWIATNDRE
jgi:hypothetical protein